MLGRDVPELEGALVAAHGERLAVGAEGESRDRLGRVGGRIEGRPEDVPQYARAVAEVAELMRVSKMTVYRLVHAGELPAIRFGRSYRVPESAVAEALRPCSVRSRR